MITYTSIDRIISMIERELGDTVPFNEEDYIEWAGEAMEFLSVFPILEEKVEVLKVRNHKAYIPKGLVSIQRLVRPDSEVIVQEFAKKIVEEYNIDGCNPEPIPCGKEPYSVRYEMFTRVCTKEKGYAPIKLSNNSFLKNIVCKEPNFEDLYKDSKDEYTIIGTTNKELVLSFKEGDVILSYVAMATDTETGYPLIPDHSDFTAAVTYYIKWKVSEAMSWRGREGYSQMMQYARQEWLRYARQAKSWAKMPKSLDEWQANLEAQYNLIPNLKKYAGYSSKQL